ncbi:MAG: hypothetical protein AB1480_08175 [Nitrospirota bacterium]
MEAIVQKISNIWRTNLDLLEKDDEVNGVSGEAIFSIFKILEPLIIDKYEKLKIKFKMIAGPIISIDEETEMNPVIELNNKGALELYISPYRQIVHFITFGNKIMYQENYHYPFAEERTGFTIKDNALIEKYRFDFYNLIKVLKLERYPKGYTPIFLSKKQISELSAKLKYKYDFLSKDAMKFMSANL